MDTTLCPHNTIHIIHNGWSYYLNRITGAETLVKSSTAPSAPAQCGECLQTLPPAMDAEARAIVEELLKPTAHKKDNDDSL
jgi:hypothetical protein